MRKLLLLVLWISARVMAQESVRRDGMETPKARTYRIQKRKRHCGRRCTFQQSTYRHSWTEREGVGVSPRVKNRRGGLGVRVVYQVPQVVGYTFPV